MTNEEYYTAAKEDPSFGHHFDKSRPVDFVKDKIEDLLLTCMTDGEVETGDDRYKVFSEVIENLASVSLSERQRYEDND
jgi:hypothetical protein